MSPPWHTRGLFRFVFFFFKLIFDIVSSRGAESEPESESSRPHCFSAPSKLLFASRLLNAIGNPAILATRRSFGSWWPFSPLLVPTRLPGHSAPAWSLGELKTNRCLPGRLVMSRTTGALSDVRCVTDCSTQVQQHIFFKHCSLPLVHRLRGALLVDTL